MSLAAYEQLRRMGAGPLSMKRCPASLAGLRRGYVVLLEPLNESGCEGFCYAHVR